MKSGRIRGPQAFSALSKGFVIIGLSLLLVAAGCWAYRYFRTLSWSVVPGEITALVTKPSKSGARYQVSFRSQPNGPFHTFVSLIHTSPVRYAVGDLVEVFYDPGNPENAVLKDFFELWFFVLLFSLLGTTFTLIGVGFRIAYVIWKRKQARGNSPHAVQ